MTVPVPTLPNVCFCEKKNKCVEMNKNVSKFYLSGSVALNIPDLKAVDYNKVWLSCIGGLRNFDKFKKRLAKSRLV